MDAAVQLHPAAPEVMAILPAPAAALNDWLEGSREKAQAAPACVMVNCCPATVIDPVRCAVSEFAARLKVMVALPEPEAGDVSVIQGAPALAVQAQEEFEALSGKLPVVAGPANEAPGDGRENEQLAAAWLTECSLSPMEIVVVREAGLVFAATRYVTDPAPVPDPPEVRTTHGSEGVAVQPQPLSEAVTPTVYSPSVLPTLTVAGLRVSEQEPACTTLNGKPATVKVADRGLVVGFAVKEYPTGPDPVREEPLVITTQEAGELAVQEHVELEALTEMELAPAEAGTFWLPCGDRVYEQGAPAWVSSKLCPETVMTACRAAGSVLAVCKKLSAVDPEPLGGEVSVSQG